MVENLIRSDQPGSISSEKEDFTMPGTPFSLSFSAGGFLSIYAIGAIQALLEQTPEILTSAPRVYGSSAGSLVAAAVACRFSLDSMKKVFHGAAGDVKRGRFSSFFPGYYVLQSLQKTLCQILSENCHQMATGRLYISLTRFIDCKNVVVSEYNSKEELIQVLICSCFVPVYCGITVPSFRGVRYFDGGFTNMQPYSDRETTITVSPYSGEVDICPRDCTAIFFCMDLSHNSFQISLENLCRISYALFLPSCQILDEFCSKGYQDAILFLHRNNILEIGYLAKTIPFEYAGVFRKKDVFHASSRTYIHESGMEALNVSIKITSEELSKRSMSMDNTVHRTENRLLHHLPLPCPKDVVLMEKKKGLINSVSGFVLQQIVSVKPLTSLAYFVYKKLEQLRHAVEKISWSGRHLKKLK